MEAEVILGLKIGLVLKVDTADDFRVKNLLPPETKPISLRSVIVFPRHCLRNAWAN